MRSRTISRNIATSPCKLLNAVCSLASISPLSRMSSAKGSAAEPWQGRVHAALPSAPLIHYPLSYLKLSKLCASRHKSLAAGGCPQGRGFAPKPVDLRGQEVTRRNIPSVT
jgi:hypothetical protein